MNEILKLSITRDGEHVVNGTVGAFSAIPDMLFATAQHYGNGEYIARAAEDVPALELTANQPIFRLTFDWMED